MRIAIIGMGRFGTALARDLARRPEFHVVAVDSDTALVERLQGEGCDFVRPIEGWESEDWAAVGIDKEIDLAVVAIGEDGEMAQRWVMGLLDLGVARIVARAQTPLVARLMERLLSRKPPRNGFEVLMPEAEAAQRLGHRIANPLLRGWLALDDGSEDLVATFTLPKSMASATVAELDLRGRFGINILRVRRYDAGREEHVSLPVAPDLVLERGDDLAVLGTSEALERLRTAD